MRPTLLQEWAEVNDPRDSGLYYKSGFWDQICFVRDKLPGIVHAIYGGDSKKAGQVRDTLVALSVHTSMSVRLPVFHMTLPDGTECVMRYNFHDWKISVKASHNITCDFAGLFNPDEQIGRLYCEGFPAEWISEPYSRNKQEFMLELLSEYEVFTFFWLLIRSLATEQKAAAA